MLTMLFSYLTVIFNDSSEPWQLGFQDGGSPAHESITELYTGFYSFINAGNGIPFGEYYHFPVTNMSLATYALSIVISLSFVYFISDILASKNSKIEFVKSFILVAVIYFVVFKLFSILLVFTGINIFQPSTVYVPLDYVWKRGIGTSIIVFYSIVKGNGPIGVLKTLFISLFFAVNIPYLHGYFEHNNMVKLQIIPGSPSHNDPSQQPSTPKHVPYYGYYWNMAGSSLSGALSGAGLESIATTVARGPHSPGRTGLFALMGGFAGALDSHGSHIDRQWTGSNVLVAQSNMLALHQSDIKADLKADLLEEKKGRTELNKEIKDLRTKTMYQSEEIQDLKNMVGTLVKTNNRVLEMLEEDKKNKNANAL